MFLEGTRCKIQIVIGRSLVKDAIGYLKEIRAFDVCVEAGRSVHLDAPHGIAKLLGRVTPIDEEPVSVLSFIADSEAERQTVLYLTERLRLDVPGRGSVHAHGLSRLLAGPEYRDNRLTLPEVTSKFVSENLMGIVCIVQKGFGNTVGLVGLTTGTAIPAITYGIGTGLRNRLGTWRILIPAEKEIATVVTAAEDAETVMDMMIGAGQLDQPGKGFIYMFPVSLGMLDMKFHVGTTSQAASIEQIVSAIDEMKGTTEWRRKSLNSVSENRKSRIFLTDLVDFSMICNEGYGEALTRVAMDSGAAGATIRKIKHLALDGRESRISPAREISVMTVAESSVEPIAQALEAAGLFASDASGELHLSPVPRAFTYLGK